MADYILYHTFLLVESLIKIQNNILNKSFAYVPIYIGIINNIVLLDEAGDFKDFSDIEEY